MVKKSLLFLCLIFTVTSSWAVRFEAAVDRSQISEGESLILTVRYNNNILTGNPDFNPLKQQFEVINQQRKSSFQFMNGKSDSWTIWTIHLMPKRMGNLVIPSLEFKGENSKAIQVQVAKVSNAVKQQQQKDVFFHTDIDVKTAYVQGQILYSEKLYFSVKLDNSQLNEVLIDEAVVQALGETKNYRTQLNGRTFDVYERNYVIYPQASGEMIIPGPRYTGEVSNGPWRPGRPIRVSQPPLKVQVLPQPASYPNTTWLPAKNIQLDYKWHGDPTTLTLGEPITLQIEFKAQGLSQAQLPDITLKATKGFKYYPDQAKTSDTSNGQGITGVRSQSIAIVPTQVGSHTLPEIRVPWWNTQYGRVEYAVIPAQRITTFKGTQTTNIPETPLLSDTPVASSQTQITAGQPQSESSKFWPITSLVLFLLWLATAFMWWYQSQTSKKANVDTKAQFQAPKANLKDIRHACRDNDAKQVRLYVLAWARTQLQIDTSSLSQLAKHIQEPSLSAALQALDNHLYSPQEQKSWQGEYLWQLIKTYKSDNNSQQVGLAPLYPHSDKITDTPDKKQAAHG